MMTFEEFQQLSANPPRKEVPTIFIVKVYGIDADDTEEQNTDSESLLTSTVF